MHANMPKKPPSINKPSMLLRSDENDMLFNIIGYRCVTLATAVVQVFLAEPPSIARWTKRHCGVCCFIKDNAKKSYFIRVFDIYKKTLIWEQELYNDFKYNTPRPYFHTFETDDGQAGFNFSDENEANQFKGILLEKIRPKRDRKQGRRNDIKTPQGNGGGGSNISTNNTTGYLPTTEKLEKKKDKKKDKKKAKITKADIGLPTDFKHVQHVGWDPAKGFDVDLDNIDPGLRDFFNKAGISESQLKDKDTAQFIYDFIDQMGGIDRIKREVASNAPQPGSAPPPVPIRGNMGAPPPPPTRGNMGAPPPPPARSGGIPFPSTNRPVEPSARITSVSHPPPPPTRNLPPIPVSATSPVRPPQIKSPPTAAPPSVPSGGGGPPPPPPPPPPMAAAPPPPPLPVGGIPGAGDPSPPSTVGRSALLEQIKQGTALNPVEQAPRTSNDGSSRGELLNQIRQGIELKPVEAPQPRATSAPPGELDGMAAALARALAERSKAIHSSDDEEDDDDEDEEEDDEWED